jgi:hypothetical protein
MRAIDDGRRRARLVRRHHLAGDAATVELAARGVTVLHATDPATVYLSVLARSAASTVADVASAMYDDRSLVRLLAMRRTLFVVPRALVPAVHHGAAVDVAAQQRQRLLGQLGTLPTEPRVPTGAALRDWLEEAQSDTVAALERRGTATGAQLSRDVPQLRTAFLPTTDKAWDVRRNVTTQVLTLTGLEGRIVRARPQGAWTSRQHTWQPSKAWWPDGIAEQADARAALVSAYLARFGPATEQDVSWWTGWTLRDTRRALSALDLEQVALDDAGTGVVLAGDADDEEAVEPVAALLPALDPTPMGWKERGFFLPEDSAGGYGGLYDRNGNIGPTVWWDGRVVGAWTVRPDGTIVTALLTALPREAERAVAEQVERLQGRLEGAVVVPSFPTPLERSLRRP